MSLTVRTAPVLPVVSPTPDKASVLPTPNALPPSIILTDVTALLSTVTLAVAFLPTVDAPNPTNLTLY